MKRFNNLYEKIISIENLELADKKARKGKSKQYGVIQHDLNKTNNILELHKLLSEKKFKTSKYTIFKIFEHKERDVYRLPYYPDRIVHHSIMNVMESIWVSTYTSDTYSCIKGRGIHGCFYKLKKVLKENVDETTYCLKLDIKKFYPSIDHTILKSILRKKIKDNNLLLLLDEIIDSTEQGVPIGNLLSQSFANLYLTYFDHFLKEQLKVKYYFRYADDIVILHSDKNYLHQILADIKQYLTVLKLEVKENYQIFPVSKRGIDFVGYKFFHTHILVRKSIKKSFCRSNNRRSIPSYLGWLKHADTKNLLNNMQIKKFSELNITISKPFSGKKKKIDELLNVEIIINRFKLTESKFNTSTKCLYLDVDHNNENFLIFTGSMNLIEITSKIKESDLPISATIVKEYNRYNLK